MRRAVFVLIFLLVNVPAFSQFYSDRCVKDCDSRRSECYAGTSGRKELTPVEVLDRRKQCDSAHENVCAAGCFSAEQTCLEIFNTYSMCRLNVMTNIYNKNSRVEPFIKCATGVGSRPKFCEFTIEYGE
jgi:hypothetical protein